MDFHAQLIHILEVTDKVATDAASFGLPQAGIVSVVAGGLDRLLTHVSEQTGKTREEIASETKIAGAADLVELLADLQKGE